MNMSMDSIDFSSGPLCCPLTGSDLQLLDSDEEVLAINTALESGDLTLVAGKISGEKIDAVLTSPDGQYQYPIIGGIPCLLNDFRIVKETDNDPTKKVSIRMSALQREQWVEISKHYEKWVCEEDGINTRVQEEFQRRNSERLSAKGTVVLDIGNGGATANQQLGPEIASSVKTFYALDSSYPMLTRNGINGNQILGDATKIPFSDKSVDYVLINNTLHHFGRHIDSDPLKKMKEFFTEAFRVSRNGIIGVEFIVPHLGQQAEAFVLKFLKYMPTFVYSERFYLDLIQELEVEVLEFDSILHRKLISPFKFGPPIMDLPLIQLPAFMMPYSYLFYRLRPKTS